MTTISRILNPLYQQLVYRLARDRVDAWLADQSLTRDIYGEENFRELMSEQMQIQAANLRYLGAALGLVAAVAIFS